MDKAPHLVTTERYEERLAICGQCHFYRKNICHGCGCNMTIKARAKHTSCPIGKWQKIPLQFD